jgi:hemerythrin-like metal-binding protein
MEKQGIVEWNDRYAVGIQHIDDQHRVLLRLINNLYRDYSGEDAGTNPRFNLAVYGLINYIKYHFAGEEHILVRMKYPDYAAHKGQHDEFVRELLERMDNLGRRRAASPKNLIRYIRDWMVTHITLIDKKYATYVQFINGQINSAGRGFYSVPPMRMPQPGFSSGSAEIPTELFFG